MPIRDSSVHSDLLRDSERRLSGAGLVALLLLVLLPAPAAARLCSTDPVPAATLLFPFLSGTYSAASTATNPLANYDKPHTLFSITNVSSSAKIVHLVLWNDMGYPLLDWDVLMTGYDVVSFDFARIMEGYLVATGPDTNPATGRPYSPTGGRPAIQGPVPTYHQAGWWGVDLPNFPTYLSAPSSVGGRRNTKDSVYGLCTNPVYTPPESIDPSSQSGRLPAYLLARIWAGLRKTQLMSENGWWGTELGPPDFIPPTWLTNRETRDPVSAWITADVVSACAIGGPWEGAPYFEKYARPVTSSWYANNRGSNFRVTLGNVLIGDVMEEDATGFFGMRTAVAIEVDNQDVHNDPASARGARTGATFYRYGAHECGPDLGESYLPACRDQLTGTGIGEDFVTASPAWTGVSTPLPSGDFRESLPSAFAFRWIAGPTPPMATKIRIWKEFVDVVPGYGYSYVDAQGDYSYVAWDEEEHVYVISATCDPFPCGPIVGEISALPLRTQEIPLEILYLPRSLSR